jgi:hypothetical protein
MKKIKIAALAFMVLVAFGIASSNPLPEPTITEYSVDPPWIEVIEYLVDVGDTFWTTGGPVIITEIDSSETGVVVLDSSNTTGFLLDPESDSIIFPTGYYCNVIAYGNLGWFGLPPLPGESIMSGYYRVDEMNWDVAYGFCDEPDPGYWAVLYNIGGEWGETDLVINEISLHSTWRDNSGFIELYNRGDEPLDAGDLFLIGDARIEFPGSTIVSPGGYLVIDEIDFPDGFALNYEADNLYLIDGGGSVLDQVGWSSDHGENVSFMRYPDGDCENNFRGYNDSTSFSFEDGFPSRGAPNRHESPGFVVIGTRALAGESWVDLHWTNPIWDPEYNASKVLRSFEHFPETPDDGEVVYQGDGQYVQDVDIPAQVWVYYTVFARNNGGEYSTPTDESRASIMLGSVGVIDDEELPRRISFLRCYPNPFNATVNISYGLTENSDVIVEIYNIVGQRVATIFGGVQDGGEHSVTWDASSFPSGVYFARLEAGGYSESVKMVLLK